MKDVISFRPDEDVRQLLTARQAESGLRYTSIAVNDALRQALTPRYGTKATRKFQVENGLTDFDLASTTNNRKNK